MPTSYTSLLGMALPSTGELTGTWGATVNDYLTQYVDAAVAGAQTISGSQTAVTLSTTNGGALVSAGSGATGSAQYAIINCTGNPAGLLTVTAPATSKVYLVLNNTSTNQSVKVVGAGPTTGVTVTAARSALIAWNGTDFELVASTDAAALSGILATANGGTGLSTFTAANNALYSTSASVLTAGTLPVAAGGTGATTLTANSVILGNGTSAVQFVAPGTNGNVLTSDGTTWTSAAVSGFVTPAGNNAFTGANTFYNNTGQTFGTATSTQDGIVIAGRAGGSSSYRVTLTPATLSSSRTLTLPNVTDTVATIGTAQTFTAAQTFRAASAIRSEAASTQDAVVLAGRAGGTSSYASTITPATLSANRTVTLPNESFTVGFRNIPAVGTQTGSYTLQTADVGKYVQVGSGGSITIPNATFAEGDVISVFNNTSGAITITCSITTAYISGTDSDKASVSLATRGVATILFISSSVCVISGAVS